MPAHLPPSLTAWLIAVSWEAALAAEVAGMANCQRSRSSLVLSLRSSQALGLSLSHASVPLVQCSCFSKSLKSSFYVFAFCVKNYALVLISSFHQSTWLPPNMKLKVISGLGWWKMSSMCALCFIQQATNKDSGIKVASSVKTGQLRIAYWLFGSINVAGRDFLLVSISSWVRGQ
jgi:hypothetical protein